MQKLTTGATDWSCGSAEAHGRQIPHAVGSTSDLKFRDQKIRISALVVAFEAC
jgi:hypothetical protein